MEDALPTPVIVSSRVIATQSAASFTAASDNAVWPTWSASNPISRRMAPRTGIAVTLVQMPTATAKPMGCAPAVASQVAIQAPRRTP